MSQAFASFTANQIMPDVSYASGKCWTEGNIQPQEWMGYLVQGLAYDAVNVMEEGFRNVMRENPGIFKYHRTYSSGSSGRNKPLSCDMTQDGRQIPWEHGATISKALKNLKTNGITGQIR
ncbi:AGAP006027PAlike [Caligus rogercresseyi]|uniref:AGAP006027PAlike n=1 Tax=Caligus rogercresseyi TaxID=217165 RepID=A0A7T8K8Q5_CALRO|nr:AGAP006027PAlike [Caligus rogercresseyi]